MTTDILAGQLLGPLGLVVALLLAMIGLYAQWWVPGWLYRNEVRRGDRAEIHADRATRAMLKSAGVSEVLLDQVKRPAAGESGREE